MNQITITVELNARNLKILEQLCSEEKPARKAKPAPEPAPVIEESPVIEAEWVKEETDEAVSLQDVKAVCLQMSKAGRQAELKAAFAKFGGKKLSDIKAEDYAALLKELGNA